MGRKVHAIQNPAYRPTGEVFGGAAAAAALVNALMPSQPGKTRAGDVARFRDQDAKGFSFADRLNANMPFLFLVDFQA